MLAAAALAVSMAASPDLSWMSGYWLACESGRETSETWSDPRGGLMVGHTLTLRGERAGFEYARIAPHEGGVAFFAQPSGGEAVVFPAVETGDRRVVFENPAHDFPQRVIYTREGDRLTGRIEGVIDGQPRTMEWRYDRAELNARCPS